MNNKIKLEEGKIYKGENGINYLVIQSRKNIALLKANEYVIANGTMQDSNTNEISWNYGSYFSNLLSATLKFNDITLSEQEKIKALKQSLNEINNYILFSAILEHVQNKNNIKHYTLKLNDTLSKNNVNIFLNI